MIVAVANPTIEAMHMRHASELRKKVIMDAAHTRPDITKNNSDPLYFSWK